NGLCSGTFISEKAVLTAAHCAKTDGDYQVVASFGSFTTNQKVVLGPGVVDDPNDLAILIFDHNVASRGQGQVADIASSIHVGDTVRLVGFGCNNVTTRTGAGVKRTGTNVVAQISDYIEFDTPLNDSNSGAR